LKNSFNTLRKIVPCLACKGDQAYQKKKGVQNLLRKKKDIEHQKLRRNKKRMNSPKYPHALHLKPTQQLSQVSKGVNFNNISHITKEALHI